MESVRKHHGADIFEGALFGIEIKTVALVFIGGRLWVELPSDVHS